MTAPIVSAEFSSDCGAEINQKQAFRSSLASCLQRIPADDFPQRMTILGRLLTLAFFSAAYVGMFVAISYLMRTLVSLVPLMQYIPFWVSATIAPLPILFLVWQSTELYREFLCDVYRFAIAVVEYMVAIVFVGSAEAFGLAERIVDMLYAIACIVLAIIPGLATYILKDSASLVFLQQFIHDDIPWRSISIYTAVGAIIYSTVVITIYWLVIALIVSKRFRSMLARPKLSLDVSRMQNYRSSSRQFRVAHLSDLHAMANGQVLAENPGRRVCLDSISGILSTLSNVEGLDAIVVSGDLTDKGDIDSWMALLSNQSFEKIADRIVIAPGNHDLNPIETGFWRSVRRLADLRKTGQNLRALRYLQAATALMGDRAELICPYTQSLATLSTVMERARGDLDAWSNRDSHNKVKVRKRALLPRELLDMCFPMRVRIRGDGFELGPSFLVWNSVSPTGWPLLNAVGDIEVKQVERASKLISASDVGALLHVMHHQLAQPKPRELVSPPRRTKKDVITSGWTVLLRASGVVDWIESLGQRTIIFHGHKHKYFVGEMTGGQTTIVSAPSATLGCEESFMDGVTKSENGSWLEISLRVQEWHTHLVGVVPHEFAVGGGAESAG